jgi:vancomycin resistance protein VanJ
MGFRLHHDRFPGGMPVQTVWKRTPIEPKASHRRGRTERIVQGLAYTYLFLVSGLTCLTWAAGDQWWVATAMLFGPRWPIVLPLLALFPLALLCCRRVLPWLAGAGALAIWLFMGWAIPWQRVTGIFAPPPDLTLRVIAYNCGETEKADVIQTIEDLRPDIIALNEWHGSRPIPDSLAQGFYVGRDGGNVVLSRFPIESIKALESEWLKPWEQRAVKCFVRTKVGLVQVVCLHLETPRHGMAEVRHSFWRGAEGMRSNTEKRRLESELASQFADGFSGPSIVAGDLNTPVESRIYQVYWSQWQNAFSQGGFGLGHTKFLRLYGVRIDHILISPHWRVISARVGPDLGGDHRPVIADLALRL